MLHQQIVEKLTGDLRIPSLHIVREYFEMEFLYQLSLSPLSEYVIFYGGTALRLAHHSFRFSEDLDFLFKQYKTGTKDARIQELRHICEHMHKEYEEVKIEEIIDKRNTLFGLLHIGHSALKHPIRIKIEMSKKKNGIQAEPLLLSSPISTKNVILHTATLKSLRNLKRNAIKKRTLPRDWFDYWYLCQQLHIKNDIKRKFPFAQKAFENEMKRWLPRDKWKIIKTIVHFYH